MKLQLVIILCIVSILSTDAKTGETDEKLQCYQCVPEGSDKSCEKHDDKHLKPCHDENDARNTLCTTVTTFTQILERGCKSITELESMKGYYVLTDLKSDCNQIDNGTFYCVCHTSACNYTPAPADALKTDPPTPPSTAGLNPTTFNQVIVPVTLLSLSMWQYANY